MIKRLKSGYWTVYATDGRKVCTVKSARKALEIFRAINRLK